MTKIEEVFEAEAISELPKRQRETKPIDISIAQNIIKKYKASGNNLFGMPIKTINDLCGYGKVDKLRTRQIQNRLNEQHGNLLDDNKEFWVGTAGKRQYYTFDIRAKGTPKRKKEEPEA